MSILVFMDKKLQCLDMQNVTFHYVFQSNKWYLEQNPRVYGSGINYMFEAGTFLQGVDSDGQAYYFKCTGSIVDEGIMSGTPFIAQVEIAIIASLGYAWDFVK